ncbi:hypothetical protein MKQ70_17695 [Chitinophaga sedimenti]|uniref:hypothetical protein n=1 Tax=Chitinophaga sedimenti TaxID=2033606 RepID=UPI002005C0A4|nr:hypothetical protein [Chitinophaga sedimenti]MCK7556753.1 hypothetical protein [Chitinophaga sedimenti]
MPRIAATLFFLLYGLTSYAQQDSAMSVYLYDTKFKHKVQRRHNFNRDSFYLRRGVVYVAKIRDTYHRPLQLLDITENTLVFRNLSGTYRNEPDTFFSSPVTSRNYN